jgi:hypothetical protein
MKRLLTILALLRIHRLRSPMDDHQKVIQVDVKDLVTLEEIRLVALELNERILVGQSMTHSTFHRSLMGRIFKGSEEPFQRRRSLRCRSEGTLRTAPSVGACIPQGGHRTNLRPWMMTTMSAGRPPMGLGLSLAQFQNRKGKLLEGARKKGNPSSRTHGTVAGYQE